MPFSFNPLTGTLERIGDASQVSFYKYYAVVDSTLLTTRQIDLGFVPIQDSELFFLNGLILKDDNYSVSSTILTIDSFLDIELGDEIDIRFAI